MFIKFYVTLNEKTKIDVSLSHFDIEKRPNKLTLQKPKNQQEDKEA
jgi:hypothetical protein